MPGAPILVVDDTPVNLKLMRLLLTHEGYEVRTAERAEEALHMLASYRPELILADIRLPGMDGLEMTRRIKEDARTATIRVVALSACDLSTDKDEALNAGCEDFIPKPINTTTLASQVRELLERHPVGQKKAEPPRDVWAELGLPASEMENLRLRFLNDGAERSRQLLVSMGSIFNVTRAASQLHQWAGSGGLLGYPEISKLARWAEELLREQPDQTSEISDALSNLACLFGELRDSMATPVPEHMIQALARKRIGLVGFTPELADSVIELLKRADARPCPLAAADDAGSKAVQECDLVMIHVRPKTMGCPWLQPDPEIPVTSNLVLAGERRDLMTIGPEVRTRVAEYVVVPWEPEEMLMRLALAISRTAPATSAHCADVASIAALSVAVGARATVTRPRVVLADDDAIVLALVGSTLQNYGMSCRSFDNGHDALRMILDEKPQVAVLDVNMPGMNGYEVLTAIREAKLATHVVLLSARQQEQDILRAFHLGTDDYLIKPFNPLELVARLKRLLRQ